VIASLDAALDARVHSVPMVQAMPEESDACSVTLRCGENPGTIGVHLLSLGKPVTLLLEVSKDVCEAMARFLHNVLSNPMPCHEYFEYVNGSNEAIIELSCYEGPFYRKS